VHYTLRLADGAELRAHAAPDAPLHPVGARVQAVWSRGDVIRVGSGAG